MKVVLFANTAWYLYNFRRSLAFSLRDAGHEVLLVSPPGMYGAQLTAMGLRWTPAPMDRRSLNPLREAALIVWLRRLYRTERVDLVHGFTIKCAVYGSLAARMAGVPARVNAVAGMGYVFTSTDLKARALRPIVRALMRLAFGGPGARLVLQNSANVAFFVNDGIVHPRQISLIPGSGVDCQQFTPNKTPSATVARERFRVVLPARLLWDKGIAEYVEASRILRNQGYSIDFLLVGEPDAGSPDTVPEATIRDWVAEGLVNWLGHVADMPSLLQNVDSLVLPTSYGEGLPKSLIEAAACALPLITTDVPGCRDVVTHEVDGLLVPVRNAQALAEAIARLHDDPALRHRLGQAAREKALREFDEQLVIQRTMAVYDALLTKSNSH